MRGVDAGAYSLRRLVSPRRSVTRQQMPDAMRVTSRTWQMRDRTVGDSALLTVRLDLINRLPDVDVQHGDATSLPFPAWASSRRGSRMSI